MTHEEARLTARAKLKEYADQHLQPSKNGMYICPFCGSGTGRNGTGAFSIDTKKGNEYWHCFSCERGGDIFDLIGELKGVKGNANETFAETYKELDIDMFAEYKEPIKKETPAEEPKKNYVPFFLEAEKNIDHCNYLDNRGISKELQKRFHIGFIENWRSPTALREGKNVYPSARIIIPTSESSYIARAITENTAPKMKEGKTNIFNPDGLRSGKPCFIVEGEIDALSVLEVGAEAVGLGSTNNAKKLLELLKEEKPTAPLILSLDNDASGSKATKELSEGLTALGIEHFTADILNGAKDPNEALVKDRELFEKSVAEAVSRPSEYSLTSAGNRLELFNENIKKSANTPPISTGFYNLDKALDGGIIPALYVLGAISSLGKTTFVLQMADQMASNGNDVLIFSLEMSEYELMAKSLSRLTFKYCNENTKNAKTVRGILNGSAYDSYSEEEKKLIEYAKSVYSRYAKNIYIKQGNVSNTGVAEIEEAIKQHISFTGRTPIVVIDYLQIIKPYSERATDKQSTDYNISMLKNICRNYNVAVFGISSFNRDNYNSPVNMSAFKESGSLEYSADVLLALQPEGMQDEEKKKAENIVTVRNCKASAERDIELVILKNRNGATNKTLNFKYYAMFNCFKEVKNKDWSTQYLAKREEW